MKRRQFIASAAAMSCVPLIARPQVRPSPSSVGGLPVIATIWGPVESEWMADGTLMHQCVSNNVCRANGYQPGDMPFISGKVRFPYYFAEVRNGVATYYIVAGRTDAAGDLYLWYSPDGFTNWQLGNCGEPVLRMQANGPLWWIANAAIAPIGDVWHMWVECGGGIGYAQAPARGMKDFNSGFSGLVIPSGGNPWVRVKSDRVVLLHGMYRDNFFDGAWYTTRSEAPLSNPASMTVRRDLVMLGENSIDICDPAYTDGRLTVSYNQDRLLVLQTPTNYV